MDERNIPSLTSQLKYFSTNIALIGALQSRVVFQLLYFM